MRAVILALCAALLAAEASAKDVPAPTCNQPDVQKAIDSAVTGDRVVVPAGSCTWTAPVVWIDKNVHVDGAGIGQTIVTSHQQFIFFVHITDPAGGAFRISDFTFKGDVAEVLKVSSNSIAAVPAGMWRLDHNEFDFTASAVDHGAVHQVGVNYGVIDHNIFRWPQGGIIIRHAFGLNAEDGSGDKSTWPGNFASQIPTGLGGPAFTFVEDNQFFGYRNNFIDVYDSSAGGGRVVFRHNTLNGPFRFYNHWTRGKEVAAQAMEIYNNSWLLGTAPLSTFDPQHIVRIEGGTGVFFNNASNYNRGAPFIILDDRRSGGFGGPVGGEAGPDTWGRCDGTHPWDGNAGDPAAPGWPCLFQIGRGSTTQTSFVNLAAGTVEQPSIPFTLWNNGTQLGCATGGSCTDTIAAFVDPAAYIKKTPHPNGQVDYVENGSTPKPGYTPFTYPHPLVSGGSVPVPPDPTPIPPTPSIDTEKPTFTMTVGRRTGNNYPVTLTNVLDNVGIAKVEFYVDTEPEARVRLEVPTSGLTTYAARVSIKVPGSHTITAKVYDLSNNQGLGVATVKR